DATAADEDSALRLTTQDTSGHSFSKVRIVHRRRAVGAHVHHQVSIALQMVAQDLLKLKSGMIGAEYDLHRSLSPCVEQSSCCRDHCVRGKAEFLLQFLERGRGTKGLHTDCNATRAHILRPTQSRCLFDRDSGGNLRWNHAIAVLWSLLLKNFPRWHADHAHFAAFRRELLIDCQAQRNLTACGHENQFRLAARGICQNVSALCQSCRGGVLCAVERGQRLPGKDESRRLMFHLHDQAPRLGNLVGVSGTDYHKSRQGPERGKLLYWLMRWPIFAHTDRVVSKDINDGDFHDGCQTHGRARVVAEDKKAGTKRTNLA